LNRFPIQTQYQCFLLDKDNKVLMVGNPVLNYEIWKLYKEQIFGTTQEKQEKFTLIEIDKTTYDFGNIKVHSKNDIIFTIKNIGSYPLEIQQISTSCGCTAVDWERQPTEQGKSTKIKIEMTPNTPGYFNKTVKVYCNIKEFSRTFIVKGNAYM